LRGVDLGAIATATEKTGPEVALINFAVTDDLELVFETIQTTRKCQNLRDDPRVAFMAWRGDQTLQYEGVADEPDEFALRELLDVYFAAVPEARGHQGWPGLIYVRVRPSWIRLSRYGGSWSVEELTLK
jgi:hypothetical protein